MKRKHFILCFSLFFLLAAKGSVQSFELRGTIKDSITNEPLPYVTVFNQTLKEGSQTDLSGIFYLNMVSGKNELRLSHVGCQTKIMTVIIYSSRDTILYMAHHQHDIEDILISSEKNKLISLDKDKLNAEDILTSGSKPLASILDKMPGVSSLKTGFTIAKPMIQGMYGSRVVVLNNGIKQEGQQWGQEHGLEIDPYNTGQITLIKGAEALRYSGDAIGGILLVEPTAFSKTVSHISSLTLAGIDNGRQGNLSASLEKVG